MVRAAFYFACASAASVLFSIAVCNIFLALAFATLLISGEKLRFPPIKLPLALFFAGTVISMFASRDPSAGRPQIRKFFVFLMLLVVSSTLHRMADVRRLVWVWIAGASASSLLAYMQFARKWRAAHALGKDFYTYYVAERITGFMSHWMTFGGQMMIVFLLLAAWILFAKRSRERWWLWLAAAVLIKGVILLGWTRGIWMGVAAGAMYLLWMWKKWLVVVVPAVVALMLVVPGPMRERLMSSLKPHGAVDSNQHRKITWRTGWRMIQAHPVLGLGPELVNRDFMKYLPDDVHQLPDGWYGHLHNIYLHYAAERGIPTLLALLWLLGKILRDFWGGARRAPPGSDEQFFLHGAVAVVLSILVEGMVELNLGDSEVLLLFLAVVSCGYVALRTLDTPEAPSKQPLTLPA
ncbi:MAG: O-antigen ligase family protein [Acidobacteria bacterium]|nr:O-antigen ligase family protein [Acidobacteriota bacterium]